MSFKRLRYDWTTIEPGERVYNKIKEVRVYEDWYPALNGGHCDLIFNSTARVGWATGRPTPPEYSHGEWSIPGVCDEYTGRWEAKANMNYGSYSMVKEFEVVEDCYVFARYDFTGSGSASYRHISVTINGNYAAEPGVDGTRKFSKGDRIRFTFVKTANPSAAAGDVAFVSMELPSYVEADVTPIGWTYYTLHWVGESGIGTKGEDVTVEHTAHLKDDLTNKRMVTDVEDPDFYVYCYDPAEYSFNNGQHTIELNKEIDMPYISLKFDGYFNTVTDLSICSGTRGLWDNGLMLRFRSHYYGDNSTVAFAQTAYSGSKNYTIITEGNGSVTKDAILYHDLGIPYTTWHSYKLVFDREHLKGYLFVDDTEYGEFIGEVDVAGTMKSIGLLREVNIPSFRNLKVTGYNKLDAALGD